MGVGWPLVMCPSGNMEKDFALAESLARGTEVDRFIVLGLLGRGAMGEVYAAHDPELDRKIAIKLLRTGGNDTEPGDAGRARLVREAQAIAKVSHPNVVVVYDVGTFEGRVFIAMEFIAGHTLGYWLQSQPRTRSGDPRGLLRRGPRAGRRSRERAGSPRLQARERHGRRRRTGARHGLWPGASGDRSRQGGGGAVGRAVAPAGQHRQRQRQVVRSLRHLRHRGAGRGREQRRRLSRFRRLESDPGGRCHRHAGLHVTRSSFAASAAAPRAPISSASAWRCTRRSTASVRSRAPT